MCVEEGIPIAVRVLGCKPTQVITARHDATKSTAKGTKEGEAALTERNRCCETGSARAKPLGRQSGKPPGAATTGAQEGQDSQSQENGPRPERAKKTQERAHERQKPESQVEGKSPRRGPDAHAQDSRWVRHRPTGAYLPCASSPYLQCDARVQPVENDFSRCNVAFARDGFVERSQNGQRVRARSPIGTPHDRGVGDVLTEEGSQVGGIVFKFGLHPGQGAVGASVRRADGHVQCGPCQG